ncbi:uncharacterized protein A4U43_C09F13200 [Asparagus officinalis]|uniref:Uncharacterized protein n=1 Tax=Asparagus officinalis TaxID=4686 RepID=A0A5P1E7B4_ASPOF|nr:uncharacterized protein A4U43_C09F13200 [Asparagus officinalis]
MDKEVETHRLEHGPKPRRIPGSNDEEEDVEDIVTEDELMDEILHFPPAAHLPEAILEDRRSSHNYQDFEIYRDEMYEDERWKETRNLDGQ